MASFCVSGSQMIFDIDKNFYINQIKFISKIYYSQKLAFHVVISLLLNSMPFGI